MNKAEIGIKQEKQKNYVSAVIYLGNELECAEQFLNMITGCLGEKFEYYELIFVNDFSTDGTLEAVKNYIGKMKNALPVTIINMSLKQGNELAMAAGMDMAIGDFIFEFDTMEICYPEEYIFKAYEECISGNDIVAVAPEKNRSFTSRIFYKIFNSGSNSKYKLRTNVFYILSRRAVNRIKTVSDYTPYRKASYAASGLKMATLTFEGEIKGKNGDVKASKAFESLALYTGLGYKASLAISIIMLLFTLVVAVYTIVIFFSNSKPIEGWTTTMMLTSGGFFGVFLILSIVLKYLSLLLDLIFKKQKYLVESVEKINKE